LYLSRTILCVEVTRFPMGASTVPGVEVRFILAPTGRNSQ
jgi:hypothetical protein